MVLLSVIAPPVYGFVVPDMYPPDQPSKVYPLLALAVAFTVSPYFTVKVAAALVVASLLFPVWVTVWAVTFPFVVLLMVIV